MAYADEAVMQLAENPNGGGDRLYVTFDLHPWKDEEASTKEGRPVYTDREYVRIIVPGDKQNEIHRPAKDADRRKYSRQYEAFKAGAREALTGTPLAEWPAVQASQVKELAHFHVYTVEQLANLSDTSILAIGPIRALVQKAKDYLEKAKGNAPLEKMRAELAEKDNTIATMQKQMAEMGRRLDEVLKQQKK